MRVTIEFDDEHEAKIRAYFSHDREFPKIDGSMEDIELQAEQEIMEEWATDFGDHLVDLVHSALPPVPCPDPHGPLADCPTCSPSHKGS